jgi:hypothetical protein
VAARYTTYGLDSRVWILFAIWTMSAFLCPLCPFLSSVGTNLEVDRYNNYKMPKLSKLRIDWNYFWNGTWHRTYFTITEEEEPVTVAERSKAWTVFARSEVGIVGSNPTQGMDVWCVCVCVCVFLCLCCPVYKAGALRRADHPFKESHRL